MEKLILIIMELPQMQMEAGNAEKWILAIAESIRIPQEKLTV